MAAYREASRANLDKPKDAVMAEEIHAAVRDASE
jgi:hypothetical protein